MDTRALTLQIHPIQTSPIPHTCIVHRGQALRSLLGRQGGLGHEGLTIQLESCPPGRFPSLMSAAGRVQSCGVQSRTEARLPSPKTRACPSQPGVSLVSSHLLTGSWLGVVELEQGCEALCKMCTWRKYAFNHHTKWSFGPGTLDLPACSGRTLQCLLFHEKKALFPSKFQGDLGPTALSPISDSTSCLSVTGAAATSQSCHTPSHPWAFAHAHPSARHALPPLFCSPSLPFASQLSGLLL